MTDSGFIEQIEELEEMGLVRKCGKKLELTEKGKRMVAFSNENKKEYNWNILIYAGILLIIVGVLLGFYGALAGIVIVGYAYIRKKEQTQQ